MKIPREAVIPREKLTRYLLVWRPLGDKSGFLAQAGFTLENPGALLRALRVLASREEAVSDGENEYGEFLRVAGNLTGPDGLSLSVVTIWLRWDTDGSVHFVTLKPLLEQRS